MKTFLRLVRYLWPQRRDLALANFMMLFYVLFSVVSVGFIMPFIDVLFGQGASSSAGGSTNPGALFDIKAVLQQVFSAIINHYGRLTVLTYLCIFIAVGFLLKNLFAYFQSYFMAGVEQGIIRDIRLQLYTHLHRLSLSYFTEERKGNLISRIINDVQIINASLIAVVNSLFRDPPLIIVYSVVLFLFDWQLTLMVLILLPLTGAVLARIGNSLKRKSIRSQEKIADITAILDETLSGIRVVKAFAMEKFEVARFKRENDEYSRTLISLMRRRALAAPITEYLGVFVATFVLWFIGRGIITGTSSMSVGAFMLYLGIVFQIMPPLKQFGQVFNSVKEGIAAGERVFNILDIEPRIFDHPNAVEKQSFLNEIRFEHVAFAYNGRDPILKDVNLIIRKGEIVAIVGHSGVGKTTLVDLIPRFYDVTSGIIKIDDIDIRKIRISSLRSLMGIVTQDTILFNDTVRNNIAYGVLDTPLEKIIEAAKAANAHHFIEAMPKGYETIIGDRGVRLSGGERQRLAIARALLKNPPILILDEATSMLDTESELLVQEAIERLMYGRTSIVIAHRLSTVQNADKIVVLDDGYVVEEGTHEQLLQLNGLYRKLYEAQFRVEA